MFGIESFLTVCDTIERGDKMLEASAQYCFNANDKAGAYLRTPDKRSPGRSQHRKKDNPNVSSSICGILIITLL